MVHDHEVARLKDDATLSASISRHNNLGTWNYMAPEYLDGETNFPADVYSFAMSAWQIYTGCVPFSRVPWRQFHKHILTERPERPGSMNDQLWSYLQRCWVSEPHSRMEFVDIEFHLKRLLEESPLHVETHPFMSRRSGNEIHEPAGNCDRRRSTALSLNVNINQAPPTPNVRRSNGQITPISPVKSTACGMK